MQWLCGLFLGGQCLRLPERASRFEIAGVEDGVDVERLVLLSLRTIR